MQAEMPSILMIDSMEGVICSQSLSNLHYVICDRIDDCLAATFFFAGSSF